MHFDCVMLLPQKLHPEAAARIRAGLVALGWETRNDALVFSVPADPMAVDAPAVALGTMLQRLCRVSAESFVESAALTLCCRLRANDVFTEVVWVGLTPDGAVGMRVNPDVPPVFGDLLRLRDKMLRVVQHVHGKK